MNDGLIQSAERSRGTIHVKIAAIQRESAEVTLGCRRIGDIFEIIRIIISRTMLLALRVWRPRLFMPKRYIDRQSDAPWRRAFLSLRTLRLNNATPTLSRLTIRRTNNANRRTRCCYPPDGCPCSGKDFVYNVVAVITAATFSRELPRTPRTGTIILCGSPKARDCRGITSGCLTTIKRITAASWSVSLQLYIDERAAAPRRAARV